MRPENDNVETKTSDKADEVNEDIFDSLFKRYQVGLKTSMKGISIFFDCIHLLHCKCHKLNLNGGGSNIDSPIWIINDDDKCFHHAAKFRLNHQEIGKYPKRI